MSQALGEKVELPLATVEKTINCIHCNYKLSCYGYMIEGNCNCENCKGQFILTKELWNNSYTIVTKQCSHCNQETNHGVVQLYEKGITVICLICKTETTASFEQILEE